MQAPPPPNAGALVQRTVALLWPGAASHVTVLASVPPWPFPRTISESVPWVVLSAWGWARRTSEPDESSEAGLHRFSHQVLCLLPFVDFGASDWGRFCISRTSGFGEAPSGVGCGTFCSVLLRQMRIQSHSVWRVNPGDFGWHQETWSLRKQPTCSTLVILLF